ncbi:hypothetical protein [Spirosoma foliorum]|uniref:Uncharacterized protein n=1 Tax=Spirosoma foliorum TaxID=2710596 RepID=A0A7G5H2P0_9BACT|nr:hypothetical protein [Spirosoma foliorum]QMW05382.1 hypothetical protein H3H32_11060 [Spirosoma foliorum]
MIELKEYQELIQLEKDTLRKYTQGINQNIDNLIKGYRREHAKLKVGDIVRFDNYNYKIIEPAELRSFSTLDELVWDLVYIGLRMKKNGETYHDSQSGYKRREIWQGYLERGIATKVSS